MSRAQIPVYAFSRGKDDAGPLDGSTPAEPSVAETLQRLQSDLANIQKNVAELKEKNEHLAEVNSNLAEDNHNLHKLLNRYQGELHMTQVEHEKDTRNLSSIISEQKETLLRPAVDDHWVLREEFDTLLQKLHIDKRFVTKSERVEKQIECCVGYCEMIAVCIFGVLILIGTLMITADVFDTNASEPSINIPHGYFMPNALNSTCKDDMTVSLEGSSTVLRVANVLLSVGAFGFIAGYAARYFAKICSGFRLAYETQGTKKEKIKALGKNAFDSLLPGFSRNESGHHRNGYNRQADYY